MKKIMQNILILKEKSDDATDISSKGGDLYMNRFCIDEDAGNELCGVYFLRIKKDPKLFIDPNKGFDQNIIDSALRRVAETTADEMEIHLICTGRYFSRYHRQSNHSRSFTCISESMNRYKIKLALITWIKMKRAELISTEDAGRIYYGRHIYEMLDYGRKEEMKGSLNDDLEVFQEHLQFGLKSNYKNFAFTYLLSKLLDKEVEMFERRDPLFLKTIYSVYEIKLLALGHRDSKIARDLMALRDSMFVLGLCTRDTFTITICDSQMNQNENCSCWDCAPVLRLQSQFEDDLYKGHWGQDNN